MSAISRVGFWLLLAGLQSIPVATAAPACEGSERIDTLFDNGASWSLCWHSDPREHLILSEVHYTPQPGGRELRILASARIGQLNVAYDDNEVIYNDVTEFGLGDRAALLIDPADCESGTIRYQHDMPLLCERRQQGPSEIYTASEQLERQWLELFAISQVGSYTYVNGWHLHDDGTIAPWMRAMGALQRASVETDEPYGRELEGSPGLSWLNHTHNYYWRLDFDLGDSANDDVVTETRYPLTANGTRQREVSLLEQESARSIEPDALRGWQLWDSLDAVPWSWQGNVSQRTGEGAPRGGESSGFGYRITPQRYGHKLERSDDDPNTPFDFFVTTANDCERFVNNNTLFNPECADNLIDFVDGQSLQGADLVAWFRLSFHHVPRNEDRLTMHAHHDGFRIEPVNLHPLTPGLSALGNTPPLLKAPQHIEAPIGVPFELMLQASDAENQPLRYGAVNLPPGLLIDDDGVLRGTPTALGSWRVRLLVSDGSDNGSAELDFDIRAVGTLKTGRSGGALSLLLLVVLGATVLRRYSSPTTP